VNAEKDPTDLPERTESPENPEKVVKPEPPENPEKVVKEELPEVTADPEDQREPTLPLPVPPLLSLLNEPTINVALKNESASPTWIFTHRQLPFLV